MSAIFSTTGRPPNEEYDVLVEEGMLPPCTVDLPNDYISVSQVSTYLRCPKQYEWRYVKGMISPPAARMAEGKAMHKSVEVGNRERLLSGMLAPLDMLLDAYSDSWKEERVDVEDWDEDHTEDLILKRDRVFLMTYHKNYMPRVEPKNIEQRFWLTTRNLHIPVLGYIDLIAQDNHAENPEKEVVVDYKVVSRKIPQDEVDRSLQLTTYSRAANASHVRFDAFVKTKTPKVVILKSGRTLKDWLWGEQVIEGVASAITAGVFPPCLPTDYSCSAKWCGYYSRCRGG